MKTVLIPSQGSLIEYQDLLLSQEVMAIDTETTGLVVFTSQLRLLQIATYNTPVFVIDLFKISNEDKQVIKKIMKLNNTKILQNAKFDLKFLNYNGYIVEGNIFDTMIAGQLLRSNSGPFRVNLAELSRFYLGNELNKEEQTSDFSSELTTSQLQYAAKDAHILLELREVMQSDLRKAKLEKIAEIEFSCIYAIVDMELTGMKIDLNPLSAYTLLVEKQVQHYHDILDSYIVNKVVQQTFFGVEQSSSINFNSQKQVLTFLNENDIFLDDTSQSSLASYADHPIIIALKNYRKASKLYGSFLQPLPKSINSKTGRIHASYSQIGASSGRMSCHKPNMQQVPRDKKFREMFIPGKGNCFIIADYSQVELRIAAEIANDPRMIKAYKENEDLHKLTASLITNSPIDTITKEQRQSAKAVNFGLIFGMGSRGLMNYSRDTYGIDIKLEQADLFRNEYFRAYTGIKAWHNKLKRNPPTSAKSITGRRYFYSEKTGFSSFCNTPVQGSAADILKIALGNLYKKIKYSDVHIVAVVHDEIIIECKEENAIQTRDTLQKVMENAGFNFLTSVPLVADIQIASSWAEK